MGPHGNDLGALYAKNMEHFGCGVALFQPVSSADMRPPCVGYLDDNRRWNLIANIRWLGGDDPEHQDTDHKHGLKLLGREPQKMEELGIEWRPRTSIGVRQWTVDASGQTPTIGLPVGADAHIKYKSDKKFGAVLIAQKPVRLTSYDDETLFRSWLATNRSQLSSLYGAELRRYGLWIVTRTYTCQHCSINAWDSSGKEANMTMKAKANMLGDLGGDLEWTERLTDKDWSHYYAKKKGDTVVVFFDGVEVPASSWWWEGLRGRFGRQSIAKKTSKDHPSRSHSRERRSRCGSPKDMPGDQPEREKGLLNEDLWGSSAPLRRGASVDSRSTSRGRQSWCNRNKNLGRSMSTPRRLSRYLDYDQPSPKSQAGNVVLGTQTDHVDDPSPHKTRFLVPEQPHRAQSTASTVASSSSIKVRKPAAHDGGGGALPSRPSSALQRKAATPVLRHTS